MSLDDKTRAELKAQYAGSDLELYETELGPIVIKTPSEPAWHRFSARAMEENADRNAAMIDLINDCVVYPPPDKFSEIRRKRPAIMQALSIKLQALAGAKMLSEGKKL